MTARSIYNYPAVVAVIIALETLLSVSIFSQGIVEPVNTNEQIFLARTKQFNEFLDRFNYKTTFRGEPIDPEFSSKIPRSSMVSALFDLKDKRTDPASAEYSTDFIELKNQFTTEVVAKNLQIARYSENIIAEARSSVVFRGASKKISVFLTQEVVGENRIKWVILDARGEIFNFHKTDTAFIRFIPPSSNETDFMNLKRALEDTDYLHYYAVRDYEPENLTLFFYLLNTGALKFEYVNEVIYHITDLPGWSMKIKEFNRNELNSGWLISDLSENSLERYEYIRALK